MAHGFKLLTPGNPKTAKGEKVSLFKKKRLKEAKLQLATLVATHYGLSREEAAE